MKLKFDSNLDYQIDAINSAVNLFDGQKQNESNFMVPGQTSMTSFYVDENKIMFDNMGGFSLGIGNQLDISKDDIFENLKKVQEHNGLVVSKVLNGLDFNIEMETGTGKTYVYLRTIFELNNKYGFTKFIIVVPSLAIKEGVFKTLDITKDHFKSLYSNLIYDFYLYDSSKLEEVREFAVNPNVQIMIINKDSFNREDNIMNKESEELEGFKPIDLIQETNPIVIIDEPQSVIGQDDESSTLNAIESLNYLCTLRYSATHREIQNLIYKLDAVDAYNLHLVKQIEVASLESKDYNNKPYIKLEDVYLTNSSQFRAKVSVDVIDDGIIKRKIKTIKKGDDFSKITNNDLYDEYKVDTIGFDNEKYITFTLKPDILKVGEYIGDIDKLELKRIQIRKTILEHFKKELKFNKFGIKILSLFFIDKVSNYRVYGENTDSKGIYAQIFEEEYKNIVQQLKSDIQFKNFKFDDVETVHKGYFSEDNNGHYRDTYENSDVNEDIYNLIMKEKEKLLSFEEPLRFIFSHSALKEGWDNPNVFQICTLNETKSNFKKRQEIGRGLRLCVNQEGERIHDDFINILTVIANENYDAFAKSLQKEMKVELGIKFGTLKENSFSKIILNENGDTIGSEGSLKIFNDFKNKGYIKSNGKITNELKLAIKNEKVDIPEEFSNVAKEIILEIEKHVKIIEIKKAKDRKDIKFNDNIFDSSYFNQLWNKIKYKSYYMVNFDTDELINKCISALNEELNIHEPKIIYSKSKLNIDYSGVYSDGKVIPEVVKVIKENIVLPDIVSHLQKETDLTRKTIINILIESNTLNLFKLNPQKYQNDVTKIIKRELKHLSINSIEYVRLEDYFDKEKFKLMPVGHEDNTIRSNHSIYNFSVFESGIEKDFIEDLEIDGDVKLYIKLPYWFKIKTPIGNYNPDWAIMLKKNSELYFIVETKGTLNMEEIGQTQIDKIKCGIKHFESVCKEVDFEVTENYKTFKIDIVGTRLEA